MKPTPRFILLALAALSLPTFSARALNPSLFNDGFAPLTPLVAQFFTDLEAIPAGSTVTDAQLATLVADLAALPPGPVTPTADELSQLAADFGSLAVAGLVNDDLEYNLAMDFDVDYDDPDPWLPDVQSEVSFALNPPPPYDPNDPGDWSNLPLETAVPTVASVQLPGMVLTRTKFGLTGVYDTPASESPLYYSGTVRLKNRTQANAPASPVIRLTTVGLPTGETYRLSAVRASDGATVPIGKFHTHSFVPQPAGGAVLTLAHVTATTLNTKSDVIYGAGTKRLLPDGFDLNDVASLVVTDSQGNTRLTRDLAALGTSVTRIRQTRFHLYSPSPGGPGGKLMAKHSLFAGNNSMGDFLRLTARRLPANAPVTLRVDGTAVGQFTTTADGHLVIAQGVSTPLTEAYRQETPWHFYPLPAGTDLSNVQTVSLSDADGNVLVSGSL